MKRSALLRPALLAVLAYACGSAEPPPPEKPAPFVVSPERLSSIEREIPTPTAPTREGIAALVLIDVSRSMWTALLDAGSSHTISSEIVIANRAVMSLVRRFEDYATAQPGEGVLLGLSAFGGSTGPIVRELIPFAPPDAARTERELPKLADDDRTAIGDAMIAGTRALDQTGMTRRHLLVFTDGGNTDGYAPAEVMEVLARRRDADRPFVYVVTFEVDLPPFEEVRKRGGRVLAAQGTQELNATVERLLTGKILVERQQAGR